MTNKKKLILIICGLSIIIVVCAIIFLNYRYPAIMSFIEKKKVAVMQVVKSFQFSTDNSLKEWEEKVLKNKVVYKIEKSDDVESYVRATSDKAASALYYKIKLQIAKNPVISWKWRVNKFPEKKLPENLSSRKEEDFAARVYVLFPALFFTNSKVVEYVWAERLPVGTTGTSGYSKNIKVMVLESGKIENGRWAREERDIIEDYELLFGEKPRLDVGAIAFMTDADSTKTSAESVYDEITVGYKGGEKN